MLVASAFFAGIAGVLALVNVEIVSSESVGLARSTSALVATVIGGAGSFVGPVIGAVLLTFFSVAVASVTPAWPMYLGLFFVWVVVAAPEGIAGFVRRDMRVIKYGILSIIAWSTAVVMIVEPLYARAFSGMTWLIAVPCALIGVWLTHRMRIAR
jgi:branched-chain amino acid transport system permease protein